MEFKQLEAFVQVVRHGSFSRAAEQLYLTQPTISTHIKALEKELGTELIIRTSRDALPSKAGQTLYEHAVNMLSIRESAVEACKNQGGQCSGTITVAASTIPYQHVLPQAMAAFRALHPDVRFDLTSCDSAGAVSEILKGRAEIGMCGTETEHPMLVYEAFMQDELVVITPHAEPYLSMRGGDHTLSAFAGFPFVMREEGSGTRREAEANLIRQGIRPESLHVVAQMDNPDAINSAVSEGLGISIVSRLSCADFAQLGRLCVFHLGGEQITRSISLVYHKKRPMSVASAAFRQFILSQYP